MASSLLAAQLPAVNAVSLKDAMATGGSELHEVAAAAFAATSAAALEKSTETCAKKVGLHQSILQQATAFLLRYCCITTEENNDARAKKLGLSSDHSINAHPRILRRNLNKSNDVQVLRTFLPQYLHTLHDSLRDQIVLKRRQHFRNVGIRKGTQHLQSPNPPVFVSQARHYARNKLLSQTHILMQPRIHALLRCPHAL